MSPSTSEDESRSGPHHARSTSKIGKPTIKDTTRALRAAKEIIDGRDPVTQQSAILVTTEHAIASILLLTMGSPGMAAKMLNEGLVQGIEERLALYASKGGTA